MVNSGMLSEDRYTPHTHIDDVDNLVYPKSFVVFLEAVEIGNFLGLQSDDHLIISQINSDIQTDLKYSKKKKVFEFLSPHYGWRECPAELIMKFSDRLKEKTIKAAYRNQSVKMSATSVRDESTDVIEGKSLPLEYQQKYTSLQIVVYG